MKTAHTLAEPTLIVPGPLSAEQRFAGYLRVSTDKQKRSGLGLDAQRDMILSQIGKMGGGAFHEYQEAESGKLSARPQLSDALEFCRNHKGVLIVAKVDRLARDTEFLLKTKHGLGDNGIVFCDLPQLPVGPMSTFFLTVIAAIAELERGLISQRTKESLAMIRAEIAQKGFHISKEGNRITELGNPKIRAAGSGAARKRQARRKAREVLPYIRAAEKAGARTLQEKCEALINRGIRTPSGGGIWKPEQIRRVLKAAKYLEPSR